MVIPTSIYYSVFPSLPPDHLGEEWTSIPVIDQAKPNNIGGKILIRQLSDTQNEAILNFARGKA